MTKYEKEHKTFTNLKAHFTKENANAYLWSEIFLGWETEKLRGLLKNIQSTTNEIVEVLDDLLTMIEKRRAE